MFFHISSREKYLFPYDRKITAHYRLSDYSETNGQMSRNAWIPAFLHGKGISKAVPLRAWKGPKGSRKLRFPDFVTTAQMVVGCQPYAPAALPPENVPGTHFCWRLSRPQGHSAIGRILWQWKFPMTPAGIKPAAFRFVAQHLNHCATTVPISPRSVQNLKGNCRYYTISLTPLKYISYHTASCCECTTHIQYINRNSRYLAIDRKVTYWIRGNYQHMAQLLMYRQRWSPVRKYEVIVLLRWCTAGVVKLFKQWPPWPYLHSPLTSIDINN